MAIAHERLQRPAGDCPHVTLNELRYVVALAGERNFRRAAERVFVTQPALSLAIAKLEDELGVKLFERGRADVRPTTVGAQIVAQAERVLAEVGRIRDLARGGRDDLAGPIGIGFIHTAGPYLIAPLVRALQAVAPALELNLLESTTDELATRLQDGRLDLAVIALPFEYPGLTVTPLYDEDFVVIVPPRHAWAGRTQVTPGELAGERLLLLHSGHCFANQVALACPDANRRAEIHEGHSLETIRHMVASGLGISVLPKTAISGPHAGAAVAVVDFAAPVPARRVALAARTSYPRERVVALIAEALVKVGIEAGGEGLRVLAGAPGA